MRAAWEAGVPLGGVSAGSICWHVGGPTDSFGPELQPVTNGLGLLPYGCGVHYDGEDQRRPLLHRMVGDGTLPTSYATDDGCGIVYRGTEVQIRLVPKLKLEIAVNEAFVEATVEAIVHAARTGETGNVGDGKIFVLGLEDCVRIRTGERGSDAIGP